MGQLLVWGTKKQTRNTEVVNPDYFYYARCDIYREKEKALEMYTKQEQKQNRGSIYYVTAAVLKQKQSSLTAG